MIADEMLCERHGAPGCMCDAGPPHDLTPSEVLIAKVLAAVVESDAVRGISPGGRDFFNDVVAIVAALVDRGWYGPDGATDKGRALLDRARKAGVL